MSASDSRVPKLELPSEGLAFFAGVFPEDVIIHAGSFGPERDARLAKAGLGLAEIVFPDGTEYLATYVREDTPTTAHLEKIHAREEAGLYPIGSHQASIDAIVSGTFRAWL